MSLSRSLYLCRFFFPSWDTPSRSCTHTHYRLILSWYLSHTHSLCLCHTCTPSSSSLPISLTHGLFATTSKMPMRCTEHQYAFVWVVYLVGEMDERGKALFANLERGVGIFLQNCHSFLPIRRILIGRPILQDGRHTIITNSVFHKSRDLIFISSSLLF